MSCLALVTKAELPASSESFKNTTINPSKELFKVCTESYIFCKNKNEFDKRKVKALETRIKSFHKIVKSGNIGLDDTLILAQTYYNMCEVYYDSCEKDKINCAVDNIMYCLKLIKGKELDCKFVLLALNAYGFLGDIYLVQNKTEKAMQIYDKAVQLYWTYMQEKNEYGTPIDLIDIVLESPQELTSYKKMENAYTDILRNLTKMQEVLGQTNNQSYIIRGHMLLVVDFNNLSETEDYFNWINGAEKLCNFFLSYNRFREAVSHLTVASFVKNTLLDGQFNSQDLSLEGSDLYKQNKNADKTLMLLWAKYGTAILRTSAERLLRLEKGEDFEINLKSECQAKSGEQASQKLLLFTEIEEKYSILDMHHPIPVKYISDYTGAKEIFLLVLRLFKDMRLYYIPEQDMDTYAIDILNVCNAYKYMALYEEDLNSRMILQKRRAELLSHAMGFVRYDRMFNCNSLRYLRLQLAIAYSSMMDLYLEQLDIFKSPLTKGDRTGYIIKDAIDESVKNGLLNLHKYMRTE